MTLEEAKKQLISNEQIGWLGLLESAYNCKPAHIDITEVFQKWGTLEIRFEGESEYFERIVSKINLRSTEICEICGKKGVDAILDGYEQTLCNTHYNDSPAIKKWREKPAPNENLDSPPLTKDEAQKRILATCGEGWIRLVEAVYDNLPENITTINVLRKWGGLEVEYEGKNSNFEQHIMRINIESEEICTICGEHASITVIDYEDIPLCKTHFLASTADYKWSDETGVIKKA